jgi:DNA-binding NtrC family response regulator
VVLLTLGTNDAILFVDDDEDDLEAMRLFATSEFPGLDVLTARNGAEGLGILALRVCKVVVSDYHMPPGMDGVDFLRRVGDLQPDALRIILSGQPDRYVVEAGSASGFMVLSKPVDEGLLAAMIRRKLRQ